MLYRPPNVPTPSERPTRRLLALLLGIVVTVAMIAGLVSLIAEKSSTGGKSGSGIIQTGIPAPKGFTSRARTSPAILKQRDALAARPMPDTGTGHEYPYPDLSTRDPGLPIRVPYATGVDAVGVGTGFPQTIPGAIAQLMAIDVAALQSASLPGVRAVISNWAARGGPTAATWSGVSAMASLLESTGMSGAGSPALRIGVTPAMVLVKGVVGDDFTVVCTDLALDITVDGTTTPSAVVDCERMLWAGRRWVIGPGKEPAPATSVWPDTNAAITAGYKDIAR